jgi:hypothetical protein
MNKKMMYALVSIVVIIVAVVASTGAYVLMNNNGAGGSGVKNTYTVTNATSLQYDVNVTYQGTTTLSEFAGKNLGTSNIMLRIDMSGVNQDNYTTVVNGTDQTAWRATNGNWTDVSSTYNTIWAIGCGKQWNNNVNALANWNGTGECTYTDSVGTSYKIYNVVINPTLDDSLFQHPI